MKNRDFRLFELSNLPIMTDKIAQDIISSIGSQLYDNQTQKNLFKSRIVNKFGSKCAYCGAKIDVSGAEQIDHFHPANDKNRNDPANLLLTCFMCNNKKRKNSFDISLHPYCKDFHSIFKRDKYGCIVPVDITNRDALFMAEKLCFSSIARTLSYIIMLIEESVKLLTKKDYRKYESIISKLSVLDISISDISKSLILKEKLKNNADNI